jgi:hypothetical protein
MRRPVALVLFAVFPAALALACGSTPTESEGTTSEALVSCPVGQHKYCDVNEITGRLFCTCDQNTCTYATPPPPPAGSIAWVAAWASPSVNGTCPVIRTPTGLWAEIGDVIGPTVPLDYMESVPNNSALVPLTPSDCTQVPGMGSSCCTYVWWPNGYPSADGGTLPMQDVQDLCPVDGATLVPIEQIPCSYANGNHCEQPGGGGCSSCKPVPP